MLLLNISMKRVWKGLSFSSPEVTVFWWGRMDSYCPPWLSFLSTWPATRWSLSDAPPTTHFAVPCVPCSVRQAWMENPWQLLLRWDYWFYNEITEVYNEITAHLVLPVRLLNFTVRLLKITEHSVLLNLAMRLLKFTITLLNTYVVTQY